MSAHGLRFARLGRVMLLALASLGGVHSLTRNTLAQSALAPDAKPPGAKAPDAKPPGAKAAKPQAQATHDPQLRAIDPTTIPLVWRVWPLLDPYASRRENSYAFGLDSVRAVDAREANPGWSLAVGQSMSTLRPHMWVRLQRDFVFRVAQPSSFLLELSSYRFLAGIRAFGVELGPGVGLVPIAVDMSDGHFGLSGLSPSACFELSFKVGPVRTSISAQEQYVWRWFGGENTALTGMMLQLALEQIPVRRRNQHPLILQH